MSILIWIVFGLIVGLIANLIDPKPAKGGILSAVALGIAGALLGGFLSSIILGIGITGFDINSLVIATLGALLVMFIGRNLSRESNYRL